jgi:hypothetical protein
VRAVYEGAMKRVLLLAVLLAGCRTARIRDDGPAPHASSAKEAVPPKDIPPKDEPEPPLTALHPVIEGACPSARAYAVGATPVLVMYRDAWAMDPTGARPFYRMGPPVYDSFAGMTKTADHIGDVGGRDEAHAWIQLRLSSGRHEDASEVRVKGTEWRTLQTPSGQFGFFGLTHVIEQPDGSLWTYGEHSMYLDIPGDRPNDASHDKYFAWSSTGDPLKVNLPGPDMKRALRVSDGQLVSVGLTKANKPILRRWSPVKQVDDLPVSGAAAQQDDPAIAIGTKRVVIRPTKQKSVFYNYINDKLEPSKLRPRDVTSWLVTSADELLVTTSDGSLLIESKDGAVTEEKLPEPGRLAAEPSVPWLIASSGALHVRADGSWRRITLPDGPWTAETHPPSKVEWVKTIGAETWAGTVRTDVGFGLKKPGEVRTIYASKPRPALRCGAPFTMATVAPFPPNAGPSCATLAVVTATEQAKVGAALKGNAALGETLTVFGIDGLRAIAAPTPEAAKEIAKKLSAEIVCAAPSDDKRLTYRVKSGTFEP